jgi:hypothetical protein
MAINFPNNPIDGNTYEYASVKYSYVDLGSGSGFWKTITSDSGPATATEVDTGSDPDKYVTPDSLEASKYNSALNFLVPSGMISMWHGATNTIPTGWSLCDGSNGTPDLRDRFIIGAGNRWAVGSTGGNHNSIVPYHSHSAYSNTAGNHNHNGNTSSTGNHRHYASTSTAGNHNHSGDTGGDTGAHSHSISKDNDYYKYSSNTVAAGYNNAQSETDNTSTAGGHGHSLSINYNGNHNHSLYTDYQGHHHHSFTTSPEGNHSHGVGVNASGEDGTDQNIPLFYALAYIMKT